MTAKREDIKFASAYGLFFRETQAVIRSQNPDASFCEISKMVATMWDGLDPEHRDVYKNKAESLKKEYINTLTAYKTGLESNRTLLSSGKDQKIPPSTATHHRASQNQILMKVPPNHFNREQVSQQAQVQKVIPVKMAPSGDSASPAVVPDCAVQQQLNQSNVCIRRGCTNLPVSNPQWENEYCSVECVLSHCREVYNSWVKLHRDKTNKFSSLK